MSDQTEKILKMMERQKFADWYNGRFADYISGDMRHETKKTEEECREIIKNELAKMLGNS